MALADELARAGVGGGMPVALVVVPDHGVALSWPGGSRSVPSGDLTGLLRELGTLDVRWTWWSARETATALVAAGARPRACWDLGAVGRLLYGLSRDDPAALWAAERGLPAPPLLRGEPDLFDAGVADTDPVGPDGQLAPAWVRGAWREDLAKARRWAELATEVRAAQEAALGELPDPRAAPRRPALAVLTAYAESAAAALAVELAHDGLPIDRDVAGDLLRAMVGERPVDERHAEAQRRARDARVLRLFPPAGEPVDLRNPAQVRGLLARIGLDLPDTRSWRLEPHAGSLEPVAALLAWRRAERLATTYGWGWLDRHVGADGRLRGAWSAAEGAGRMSAQAGLHSLPAAMRPAVRADPGWVLVRADLGQVEPRVLAVVSADEALARAAREDDMYAPVAAQLSCDRPTAKVAVLAAMYGQTSGTAGAALRDMDRAYPRAMAYLRTAEECGRNRQDLRTYGGRLLALRRAADEAGDAGDGTEDRFAPSAWGRFARNAVVQGAAAELFKAWAVTVRAGLGAVEGRIVLCLHDELLLHVPARHADAAGELLVTSLEATARWWAAGSGVRFVAEVATGASWAEAR